MLLLPHLQQEPPLHPTRLVTPKEGWIQSMPLTILFSRDKEMQRRGNLKDT